MVNYHLCRMWQLHYINLWSIRLNWFRWGRHKPPHSQLWLRSIRRSRLYRLRLHFQWLLHWRLRVLCYLCTNWSPVRRFNRPRWNPRTLPRQWIKWSFLCHCPLHKQYHLRENCRSVSYWWRRHLLNYLWRHWWATLQRRLRMDWPRWNILVVNRHLSWKLQWPLLPQERTNCHCWLRHLPPCYAHLRLETTRYLYRLVCQHHCLLLFDPVLLWNALRWYGWLTYWFGIQLRCWRCFLQRSSFWVSVRRRSRWPPSRVLLVRLLGNRWIDVHNGRRLHEKLLLRFRLR